MDNANEIQRSECGKLYEIDPKLDIGKFGFKGRPGPIHYKQTYSDTDLWEDLDETYCEKSAIKDVGNVLIYSKLPNIVTVYQDKCGYEIQSRSNPDHIAKVELVSIDGQKVTNWLDSSDLKTYMNITANRVSLWKEFQTASRASDTVMCWKISEVGDPKKDSHPFSFRDEPEFFNVKNPALHPMPMETTKATITTTKTAISDKEFLWTEHIPNTAMLVDTDYQTASSGADGYWYYNDGLNSTSTLWVGTTSGGVSCNTFMRFITAIPYKAQIKVATIEYKSCGYEVSYNVTSRLYGELATNPDAPTTGAGADSRTLTSWHYQYTATAWTAESWYMMPSMVDLMQEIVNQSGYVEGNAIQLFQKNYGSPSTYYLGWYSYDSGSAKAPWLTVTWDIQPTRKRVGGVRFANYVSRPERRIW
jgi:hypothetical protein